MHRIGIAALLWVAILVSLGTLPSPARAQDAGVSTRARDASRSRGARDAGSAALDAAIPPMPAGVDASLILDPQTGTSSTATIARRVRADAGTAVDAALVIRKVVEVPLVTLDAGPLPDGSLGERPDAGTVRREVFIATYQGLDSPIEFYVGHGGKSARVRAKDATEALTAALERELATEPEGPPAAVILERDRAVVRVRGMIVTTLFPEDAAAAGYALEEYADLLEGKLSSYVPGQLRRNTLQLFVLHVFVSVFLIVIAVLTLRFLRRAFDRWDDLVEHRAASAISVFRVPIFSPEAAKGTLAFGISVGRFLAYFLTIAAALAAILSQFETTRPLLGRIVAGSSQPLVAGAQAFLRAIPGIVLAAGLVLALHAGMRVLHTLLDGVVRDRPGWKRLTPPRIPAFRIVANTVLVLVVVPLVIGAAFGRFGTPLEVLALAVGGAVLLAAVPSLATTAVGVVVIWRQPVHPGDWVQIGEFRGEITQVNLHELHLVPEGGGAVLVPMLYLLLHPVRRLREPPHTSVELTVARDRPTRELLETLQKTATAASSEARVELIAIDHRVLRIRASAPALKPGLKQALLLAMSEAEERGEIQLAPPDLDKIQ